MIARIIISLFLKLILDIPLMIIGYFIFPIAYKYRIENTPLVENTHLPKWANWCWGNRDHGIYGGVFYNDKLPKWIKITNKWYFFLRAYAWSVIRNPTFNWSKYILGVKSAGIQILVAGNPNVARDREAGFFYMRQGFFWDIHYVYRYKSHPDKCALLRAGWKLNGKAKGEYCQFAFVISPFKEYTGK